MADLILVPTEMERAKLDAFLPSDAGQSLALQLCGFGPVAAAARAASLISRYQPERVLLIGIAGTFRPDECPIGSAQRFEETICDGVGVGSGEEHQSAGKLGWLQFSGGDDAEPKLSDTIRLDSSFVSGIPSAGTLLTCCSASASKEDAAIRRQRFPHAIAEDMEGYAVAMACSLYSVPLQIVRGISNEVGDRDTEHWRVTEALSSAAQLALQLMLRQWIPAPS